jgi:hypothetical protein
VLVALLAQLPARGMTCANAPTTCWRGLGRVLPKVRPLTMMLSRVMNGGQSKSSARPKIKPDKRVFWQFLDNQVLSGERSGSMNAFLAWCYQNFDSESILKEFEKRDEIDGL